MATENQIPLWLQLKKEYIDDNFEKLVPYLRDRKQSRLTDEFYDTTVGLLRQRVESLTDGIASSRIYDGYTPECPAFEIRLLATFVLIAEQKDELSVRAYLGLMFLLMEGYGNFADRIAENVSHRLRQERIDNCGFTWSDIQYYSPDTFAYKCIHNVKFGSRTLGMPGRYMRCGTALLTPEGLS